MLTTEFNAGFRWVAGQFLHVAGHGIAGQSTLQFGNQLTTSLDRHLEMSGTRNAIQLMEVVRHDAQVDQRAAELLECLHGIVHVPQQHRLIQHWYARIDQLRNRYRNFAVDLGRVIGMNHNQRRQACSAKPGEQSFVHALRNQNGQTRVYSQTLKMRNRCEALDERFELRVDERQRIAATEDDFIERLVRFDGSQRRFPGNHSMRTIFVGKMSPKAVATMYGTRAGRHQQGPTGILLQQSWLLEREQIPDRITGETGLGFLLSRDRQHLKQQWIMAIAGPHSRDVPMRDQQRKIAISRQCFAGYRLG